MKKRTFLKLTGGASLWAILPIPLVRAEENPPGILVPADKGFSAAWWNALTERGEPEVYRGEELRHIGMPVGGLCAGLVYLGGDGKPWLWDIFNRSTVDKKATFAGQTFGNRNGAAYVEPLAPRSPLAQGFAIKYKSSSASGERTLDRDGGWAEISFQGPYPLATVKYRDPAVPVTVDLAAFSPFIPLNFNDSSLPATVFRYTVANAGRTPVEVELGGWLENVILASSLTGEPVTRENRTFEDADGQGVLLSARLPDAGLPPVPVAKRHDFGTMSLRVVDSSPIAGSVTACLPSGENPAKAVFAEQQAEATKTERPVAAVRQAFTLSPDERRTVDFVLAWHFPNVDPKINGPDMIHSYAARFADAGAVAQYVAANFPRLCADTKKWVETWTDSTLPHWFLNRTFCNLCNLATTTSYRFANGQFWAWEGIYACEGTCTHVWAYAQAMARIFPELERALREKTDYAFAQDSHDGTINFRGTHGGFAADGQAGIILRTYREHQMSADDSFLKGLWPRVRLAMDRLIKQANANGLLDGSQHNTLDTAWYGEVAWISGLYLAALRAAEEMAKVCGDEDYAGRCRQLFVLGSRSLALELFNGEYFINKVDPAHLDAINSGTGCEIDQLMGQSWAWQAGLGRIFPREETLTALRSLWRYNFAPDAGRYHEQMKGGRWYAMPGEAGLLMCTFPKPDWNLNKAAGKGPAWAAFYFNECMTGFEHQVASHMIAEGQVREGLAVSRAIHERYAAAKRNPFNEVECGDHYSRALASYGSFVTVCGFEYDGPKGELAFAPRLTPEKFQAAFTSARGWGSYAQEAAEGNLRARVTLQWGTLSLNVLTLQPVSGLQAKKVRVSVDGRPLAAILEAKDDRLHVRLTEPLGLTAGQQLEALLT